jgi:uncharacterized protein (UPF0276 family)
MAKDTPRRIQKIKKSIEQRILLHNVSYYSTPANGSTANGNKM